MCYVKGNVVEGHGVDGLAGELEGRSSRLVGKDLGCCDGVRWLGEGELE